MGWLVSRMAMASTGGGAGAAQPIIDYILGLVFVIVGAGLIIALVFKGIEALSEGHVGRFVSFLVLFLFVGVIIGSSRQIATAVTGFAGGATLWPECNDHLWAAVAGYLLGDIFLWSVTLALFQRLYRWMIFERYRRTIEDKYVDFT